jgi:acetyl esterase/lipase
MKRFLLIFFFLLPFVQTFAQSTIGITGKPDTSYTTYNAWLSTIKTYPDSKIVEEFRSDAVAEKRNITYCSIGDRKLMLDVFYPKQKNKDPRIAILIIHGGGWRTGNRTQHYPMAQRLASLGYVCITPEYRLSTEALYPAATYDIKSAIRWVRSNAKKYNIDTTKIVVAGFSAGGELAAFMGATNGINKFEGTDCNIIYSSTVQAVVDIDGILSFVHPESGEGDDSKRTSAATYWFGYPKKDNPALWEEASALTHAGKHTPPTIFINSSVDRMHAGRTDYITLLNKYNIYSEVKNFEGVPHSFCLFDPWFEPTVKYIDEFLKKVFNK